MHALTARAREALQGPGAGPGHETGAETGFGQGPVRSVSGGSGRRGGASTRPLFSSTQAVLVTPPRLPLSNRLGGNHAPNVYHKMCLR